MICIMVGLNWWLKPITRANNLALKPDGRPTKFSRLMSSLTHFLIVHKTVHEIPPLDDDDLDDPPTSTSSEITISTLHDDGEIPLKGKRIDVEKAQTAIGDEKL